MLQKILMSMLAKGWILKLIISIGALVGSAFLYDVKVYSNQEDFNRDKQKHFSIISKYFDGYKYGFLIRNAKMFKKPITYPGKLRFFEVDNSIIN